MQFGRFSPAERRTVTAGGRFSSLPGAFRPESRSNRTDRAIRFSDDAFMLSRWFTSIPVPPPVVNVRSPPDTRLRGSFVGSVSISPIRAFVPVSGSKLPLRTPASIVGVAPWTTPPNMPVNHANDRSTDGVASHVSTASTSTDNGHRSDRTDTLSTGLIRHGSN